jgi:hypothetical protein
MARPAVGRCSRDRFHVALDSCVRRSIMQYEPRFGLGQRKTEHAHPEKDTITGPTMYGIHSPCPLILTAKAATQKTKD